MLRVDRYRIGVGIDAIETLKPFRELPTRQHYTHIDKSVQEGL
jgi:hypothetical protein